jgi:hypothetical protein
MKLSAVVIGILAAAITLPALACGPMTSGGSMTSGSGDNTRRQRWVKKRVEHLNQQNEDYRALRARSKVNKAIGLGGEDLREFEAIQKQHKREQIELMMLKNELGEISPDERKALVEFLKRRRGHVQGQSRQRSNQ